jgi:hypothetical protein
MPTDTTWRLVHRVNNWFVVACYVSWDLATTLTNTVIARELVTAKASCCIISHNMNNETKNNKNLDLKSGSIPNDRPHTHAIPVDLQLHSTIWHPYRSVEARLNWIRKYTASWQWFPWCRCKPSCHQKWELSACPLDAKVFRPRIQRAHFLWQKKSKT